MIKLIRWLVHALLCFYYICCSMTMLCSFVITPLISRPVSLYSPSPFLSPSFPKRQCSIPNKLTNNIIPNTTLGTLPPTLLHIINPRTSRTTLPLRAHILSPRKLHHVKIHQSLRDILRDPLRVFQAKRHLVLQLDTRLLPRRQVFNGCASRCGTVRANTHADLVTCSCGQRL